MTNGWTDIQNADVILLMGGNPAENHPVGFRWALEAKRKRKAKLVSVDPRFNRTAAVADLYVPLRAGTDIAFLGGLIRYAIESRKFHDEYVRLHTNALFVVGVGYAFDEASGLFSGFDSQTHRYDKSAWGYVLDADGHARLAESLDNPRCVFQLLRRHFARYTPETVASICGCNAEDFLKAAEIVCSTYTPERAGTVMYALGWTHHSVSVQIIRAAAILQLLLGNIGRAGGGVNALRGHANIQGGTDHGVAYHSLPGYLRMPAAEHQTLADYLGAITPKKLRPNAINYWENAPKFAVSLLKALYGPRAQPENGFAYDLLPKIDGNYSWVYIFDRAVRGEMRGLLDFGMNPVANGPNSLKMLDALSRLDWLTLVECFETETATFWKAPGVDPTKVKTEVLLLPAANFAEKDGSFTNSSRWAQWKQRACEAPGEARPDQEVLARLHLALRDLYRAEGGAFPEPILQLHWPYGNAASPSLEEVAREINGRELGTGKQVSSFTELKADGSTACGNWLYAGSFTEAGNQMMRRGLTDPSGLGRHGEWAWNWPANRRILYNRAGCDAKGAPWDPTRSTLRWDGARWDGDVPDTKADAGPEAGLGAFLMLPEGVARIFAADLNDGPLPEHYEPIEHPVPNLLHPANSTNPVAPRFSTPHDRYGEAKDFPIVATTFRLTEHFHYWTQHLGPSTQLQPEFFVEVSEELAGEIGVRNRDRVRVVSPRGSAEGLALVTKRLRTLDLGGKRVHQIAIPIHWGYAGRNPGPLANLLTPTAIDPNAFTPEYKGFLVRLEKVKAST